MKKGYLIIRINIKNIELFQQYPPLSTKAVEKYGGKYLIRGGAFDVVEGSTTLFPDNSYSTAVTYIVDDRSSADAPCWTWGFDTTYYGGYEKSCTAM